MVHVFHLLTINTSGSFRTTRSAVGTQVTPIPSLHPCYFFSCIYLCQNYTYKSNHEQKDQLQPIYYNNFKFIILFLNYRIRKISNLESLTKLDVLDLHGNKVKLLEIIHVPK